MLRRIIFAATASCLLLAACHGGPVPNQVLTKPAPAAATVPVMHTGGPWSLARSSRQQAFVVDQRATITIHLDTTARIDTIASHIEITFIAAPASGAVSGSVNAFTVEGAGHTPATPAGLAIPFPVHADYPGRGMQLDFSTPHDAGACSSSAVAVSQSLRDLWFRAPDTLRIGSAWEDSSSYVVCRDGIPLRATAHRAFRVTSASEHGGRPFITITRTSRTAIDGTGTQFGEAVGVNGTGSGQLVYDLDAVSGEIIDATGTGTLDLSLKSRVRTQTVRQTVEIRIGRS